MNPSFEEYTSFQNDSYYTHGFFCPHWIVAKNNFSAFFHEDNPFKKFSTNNIYGYHKPHTGKAYSGSQIIGWYGIVDYITGTLKEPLIHGKKYKVSFFIKYAGDQCRFALSEIGAYLSTEDHPFAKKNSIYPNYSDIEPYLSEAHIKSEPGKFLFDTCWIEISGYYIAKGGEKYITIGKFKMNYPNLLDQFNLYIKYGMGKFKEQDKLVEEHQEIFKINPRFKKPKGFEKLTPPQNYWFPYYFIDDVSVELVETK